MRYIIVISILLLASCSFEAEIKSDELLQIISTCDNNKGLDYTVINGAELMKGYTKIESICKDGAKFTFGVKPMSKQTSNINTVHLIPDSLQHGISIP